MLKQLTRIINNKSPPTVANTQTSRVGKASTSNDTTAPRMVKAIHQIHRCKTRANTPIPTIIEEVDEVRNNDNIVVTGGELTVAQWHEPLISFHHTNPKGILDIIEREESRLNVDQRYPTNNSNYAKDAPNMIKVDDIKYHQKGMYTPTRRSPRLNHPQHQWRISPIGTINVALLSVIAGKMGRLKIGYQQI